MFDKSFHCFWRRHRPFEGLFHTWNNGEDNFNVQHEEDILLYFRHLVYVFLCNSFPCVVVDVPAAFQRGKCCYRHERKRKVRWRPLSERCILLSKIKYNWENWKRVIEQALQWDDDVIMWSPSLLNSSNTYSVDLSQGELEGNILMQSTLLYWVDPVWSINKNRYNWKTNW